MTTRRWMPCAVAVLAWLPVLTLAGEKISPERFDELTAKLEPDPWVKTPDASTLAWGEAARLHGFVDMYEATEDVKYLREAVRRADQVLSHRDDRRGVRDCSGTIRKAWSMGSKYVVAGGTLVSASGKPLIDVRSLPSSKNEPTRVSVKPTGDAQHFDLRVVSDLWNRTETFHNLSIDPASKDYFERRVNPEKHGASAARGESTDEPSQLVRLQRGAATGAIPVVPKEQSLKLEPLPLAFVGYVGVIYHPILRIAEIVRADSTLEKEFGPAAERYVKAADETYDQFKFLWRDGPGEGEGYYLCCLKGESFPFDNLPLPMNYLGRHTASELALFRLTNKPIYQEQATRMAHLLKNRLTLDEKKDAYVWHYWYEPVTTTGWTRADDLSLNMPDFAPAPYIEDMSHGALDIHLVASAHAMNIVFDDADLRRFVNTLMKNVILPDRSGVHAKVDGTGEGSEAYANQIREWLPLASADPSVFDACRDVYLHQKREDPAAIGAFLKWSKKLNRPVAPGQ